MIKDAEAIARQFMPVLMLDENEPFSPEAIGFTVFTGEKKSSSCSRTIDPAGLGASLAVEYAIYYDYDIQHLYDLEHAWVYVNERGEICGLESSFHGKFLNALLPGTRPFDETGRARLYVQPGKHALLPDPALFHLFIGFKSCCMEESGGEGIITPDIIPGMIGVTPEEKRLMAEYIRRNYAFCPKEVYHPYEGPVRLIPWEELAAEIPGRMKEMLKNSLIRKD